MNAPWRRPSAAGPGAAPAPAAAPAEESWFSAMDAADAVGDDAPPRTGPAGRERPILRPLAGEALRRLFQTYVAARVALGMSLLAGTLALGHFTGRYSWGVLQVCAAYVAQSTLWWLSRRVRTSQDPRTGRMAWWMTIGVDLLAFGAMHWLDPFTTFNFAALLVLPVLMAGILTPRLPALATASVVVLGLLGAAVRAGLAPGAGDMATAMSQAGLSGIGLFVVAVLSGELSMRLAHEERTARDSRERARQQAQLSRLVIEDMGEGVLVVDRQLRVRAANPSARKLLVAREKRCPSPPFPLRLHPGWIALADQVDDAFQRGDWPEGAIDVPLQLEDGSRRVLQMRARFTRGVSGGEGPVPASERLCVLFLDELKAVQARMRQERLAAMGRISAGIAHEIRNPLAAIAQATALMDEDELRPDQRRLVRIMTDNVGRLKRIVDDVMEAAPGSLAPSRTLDANAEVAAICSEWARTVGLPLGTASRLAVRLPNQPMGVVFDPDHLRRVLVNLLDNAARHASPAAGAIKLSLKPGAEPGWAVLSVASDGPPIASDVEPYLFEPFHSTRSRGTGLGLYICRELCERHGARIDFRRRESRHCNVFEVMMRRESLTAAEGRLVL